ncbi:MAG: HEAT repeat domain-containing protein [Phycisphaeraceae bacterium]|nr:HEAT repeat domain-containing protein [Phycisphaeraceae bacterium]
MQPADGGVIDLPMLRDPVLADAAHELQVDPRYAPLWLEALKRPEFDLRMNAIMSFRDLRQRGAAAPNGLLPLLVELLQNDPNRHVRLAAAQTLVTFDDRDAAGALLAAAANPDNVGLDMVRLVDEALARWNYVPARAVWLKYLASVEQAPARATSAIHSLGQTGATEARDALSAMVMDEGRTAALRLVAADALARVAADGLQPMAEALADSVSPSDRLLAVRLLTSQAGDAVTNLLAKLALDSEPPVAAAALAMLTDRDPATVCQRFVSLALADDPNVRLQIVRALSTRADADSLSVLSEHTGDPSVAVRTIVRDSLIRFDQNAELREQVRKATREHLNDDDWRSLEQAALIAGALDMEETADRLIELLNHDRPEVRLASASALRLLSLETTLPAILTQARLLTERATQVIQQPEVFLDVSNETTQLFMAIGEHRYRPADELLRQYVPKHCGFDGTTRGAAVYALGKIYEDQNVPELAELLIERLSDDNPFDPEAIPVRRFAAISLRRMKVDEALDALRWFRTEQGTPVPIKAACHWAITQLTGESLPPLNPVVQRPTGYFLEPLN